MSAPQAEDRQDAGVPVVVVLIDVHAESVEAHVRARWLKRTVASLSSIYTDPPVEPVEIEFRSNEASDLVATSCYLTESQAVDLAAAETLGVFLRTFATSAEGRRAGVLLGDTYYGILGRAS